MKQFNSRINQLLLIASLMLPWTTTGALEKFEVEGTISAISIDKFTVQSKQYRINPNLRLASYNDSKKSFTDFKKGELVYFGGEILDGVYMVDFLVLVKPESDS